MNRSGPQTSNRMRFISLVSMDPVYQLKVEKKTLRKLISKVQDIVHSNFAELLRVHQEIQDVKSGRVPNVRSDRHLSDSAIEREFFYPRSSTNNL